LTVLTGSVGLGEVGAIDEEKALGAGGPDEEMAAAEGVAGEFELGALLDGKAADLVAQADLDGVALEDVAAEDGEMTAGGAAGAEEVHGRWKIGDGRWGCDLVAEHGEEAVGRMELGDSTTGSDEAHAVASCGSM
jgi:hypothetical protein